MKSVYKIIITVLLAAMVPLVGCDTDELANRNINPQAVDEIDLNFLFTEAQVGTASGGATGDNRFIDWRTNIGMFSYAMQHLAHVTRGIAPGDKYTDNFEVNLAPWEWWYEGQLKLITEILKQTGAEGYAAGRHHNMVQASRIIRAWTYHKLVDYYNDVPYTEANQGIEGTFFPSYDDGKFVYEQAAAELMAAAAALDASQPDEGFSNSDLYFGGDVTKWKKWAYSVLLRMAMRVSNADPALAGQWVTAAVAGGVMESNDDNVWVPTALGPSEWRNQNGISRAFQPGDGGQPSIMSNTLIDELKGPLAGSTADDDPRLMIFSGGIFDWTPLGVDLIDDNPLNQIGMPNGKDLSEIQDAIAPVTNPDVFYSKINTLLLDDDDPYQLMNYAEVEFLLADALVQGMGSGISGTAAEHYEAGVRAAMTQYGPYDADGGLNVSDGAITAYLAARPFDGSAAMIHNQLWINGFLNWWESWSNWRRTGIPALVPTNHPTSVTNGVIPRRLLYPNSEIATNFDNVPCCTTPDQGYIQRVWWDTQ
ncbi:MAG: SusD/RagB family nutrient-binding outer membrane lipoprotein [Cyclobacteriaceae bacterium]|nr:SusD/RagB family nutrient-binding outer membrane lipoprotein [Cyclobacteriaceae bacterium]